MTEREDKRIYTMASERPAKTVTRMGVPLIAGMMIMVLYNLTDTFFIGMTHDDYQLAAVNLAYPVMMVMIALSNMVGTGASTLIARCLGAEDHVKAAKTLTCGMVFTIVTGLGLAMIGLLFLGPVVSGLGAKENTVVYTEDYTRILILGTVFIMGNYTLGQLLRGEGSVKYSMLGMVSGTVLNIILDPVFIFGLGMQLRGAALATVLSNAIGAGLTVWIYVSGRAILAPRRSFLKPDRAIIGEIYRVGAPAALETLLTSAAYIICNNLAVAYGELTVAAMGIAQKILSFGNYIYQGFAAGVQPVMGFNYGAKNYSRMLEILRAGVLIVSGTELAVMLFCGVGAPFLISIFTDSEEVIATGAQALRALMFILPFVGSTSMCRMSLQAMGKPMLALGITIVRQGVLYVPLLLLMDHMFGFDGLIWAQPVTEAVMMVLSVSLLVSIIHSLSKQDKNQREM